MTNAITFELNGATYTRKENGYCYMACEQSESGKIHRIGKADFEAAHKQYEAMNLTIDETPDNDQAEFDEMVRNQLTQVLSNEAYEEALEATEKSIETEEVREAAEEAQVQEKPKKAAKKRIPKSIGFRETYEGVEVILTEKQVDFIKHLPDTCFWVDVDSAVWVDCLCDEIGGQFAGKPMTVGAMISTLCEKGLGKRGKDRMNGRKCTSFALTELGREVALDLGL